MSRTDSKTSSGTPKNADSFSLHDELVQHAIAVYILRAYDRDQFTYTQDMIKFVFESGVYDKHFEWLKFLRKRLQAEFSAMKITGDVTTTSPIFNETLVSTWAKNNDHNGWDFDLVLLYYCLCHIVLGPHSRETRRVYKCLNNHIESERDYREERELIQSYLDERKQ